MSRKISDLNKEFAKKIYQLEQNCLSRGVDILIYCTYRDPYEQARAYRQGRSYDEIKEKKDYFIKMGIPEIANIIESVGPQYENSIITNAAPFESFHQYRDAVDGVPLKNGKAMWNDEQSYKIYGYEAEKLGLYWAGNWTSFTEYPHVQSVSTGNPFNHYRSDYIKKIINER